MSNDVHNILDAISEAKAALDAKPTLERRIRELEADLAESQRHNQGLEENIIGYKRSISTLESEVNLLITARDDAQLRVLELEDRIHSVSRFLSMVRGESDALDKTINPISEPTVEPSVEFPVTSPMENGEPQTETTMPPANSWTIPVPPIGYANAEVDNSTPEAKPSYANKLYYFCHNYISRTSWLENGGSDLGYDWRPAIDDSDTHSLAPLGYSTERFRA